MQTNNLKRSLVVFGVLLLLAEVPLWAVGSKDTSYIGGTINSIKEGTEGSSSAKDEKLFIFEYKDGKLNIPYDRVNDLEYGQKAGRRLGLALTISPWLLLSHKRKHFLTLGYLDENDKQKKRYNLTKIKEKLFLSKICEFQIIAITKFNR